MIVSFLFQAADTVLKVVGFLTEIGVSNHFQVLL